MADDPERSDEADELVKKLESVSVPQTPQLPPVPEIKFHKPNTYKSDDGGHDVTVSVNDDSSKLKSGHQAQSSSAASAGAAMGAGITFAASIVVGFLIGHWIDHKFGLDKGGVPWGTMIMCLAGMAAGFVNLFRLLQMDDKRGKGK